MNRLTASFNMYEWDSTFISISVLIAALIAGLASYATISFFLSRLNRRVKYAWSTILFALMLVGPTLTP